MKFIIMHNEEMEDQRVLGFLNDVESHRHARKLIGKDFLSKHEIKDKGEITLIPADSCIVPIRVAAKQAGEVKPTANDVVESMMSILGTISINLSILMDLRCDIDDIYRLKPHDAELFKLIVDATSAINNARLRLIETTGD